MKKHEIKRVLFYSVSGIGAFMILSTFHEGFNMHRTPNSFILPGVIGCLVGCVVALKNNYIEERKQKAEEFFLSLFETLSVALDERDHSTHGHSKRVADLSIRLGGIIGIKGEDLQDLHISALLHDIGKIGIPDHILLSSNKLATEQALVIRRHPEKGARILSSLNDQRSDHIAAAVRYHHEMYDGRGYPDQLTAENIPVFSRIIAIADSYDAMISQRLYSDKKSKQQALVEIQSGANVQFDPRLVELFVAMMAGKGGLDG